MMRSLVLVASGLIAGAFVALAAHADAEGGGCHEWEVMMAQPSPIISAQPAEIGKPLVEKVPSGWEPFAYSPSGALVYRRCAR